MKHLDLVTAIFRDTSEMLGKHAYISITGIFVAAFLLFGWISVMQTIVVILAVAFVVYHTPDDNDPFGPNGPMGV